MKLRRLDFILRLLLVFIGMGIIYPVLAEDASSVSSNPAGLVDLDHPQLIVSAYDLWSRNIFSGIATSSPLPAQFGFAASDQSYILPNLFFAKPINQYITGGLGITHPVDFSLSLKYPENSVLRYIYTNLTYSTLDITPALGIKINDHFSVGAGADFYYIDTTYNAMVMTGGPDAKSQNIAYGWGYGWHAGAFYRLGIATRLGLAYHSMVAFRPSGHSTFTMPPGVLFTNNDYNFGTTLPAKTTVSILQGLSTRWEVHGSLDYAEWSSVRDILLRNIQIGLGELDSSKTFNWHNIFTGTLGTNYLINQRWGVGGQIGLEQNNNEQGKYMEFLGLGAHYQASKILGINVGYTHMFTHEYPAVSVSQSTTLNGIFKPYYDIAKVELVWDLD